MRHTKACQTAHANQNATAILRPTHSGSFEQLLTTLRKSGLIRSTRGPHGGHELARGPGEMTFLDVVTALEGPLMPLDCLNDAAACVISPTCGMREVWQEVMAATRDILQRTTIEDLVARQKVRESRVMYYI